VYCIHNGISRRRLDDPAAAWVTWCGLPDRPGERRGSLCVAGGRLYLPLDSGVLCSIPLADPSAGWTRTPARVDWEAMTEAGDTLFTNDGASLLARPSADVNAAWQTFGPWKAGCRWLVAVGDRLLALGGPGPIYARPATRTPEPWVEVGRVADR
jgi:hypothetical protein